MNHDTSINSFLETNTHSHESLPSTPAVNSVRWEHLINKEDVVLTRVGENKEFLKKDGESLNDGILSICQIFSGGSLYIRTELFD